MVARDEMIRIDRHKCICSCCNKGNINSNSLEGSVDEWVVESVEVCPIRNEARDEVS